MDMMVLVNSGLLMVVMSRLPVYRDTTVQIYTGYCYHGLVTVTGLPLPPGISCFFKELMWDWSGLID